MVPLLLTRVPIFPAVFLGEDPLPTPPFRGVGILALQGIGQLNTAPTFGQILFDWLNRGLTDRVRSCFPTRSRRRTSKASLAWWMPSQLNWQSALCPQPPLPPMVPASRRRRPPTSRPTSTISLGWILNVAPSITGIRNSSPTSKTPAPAFPKSPWRTLPFSASCGSSCGMRREQPMFGAPIPIRCAKPPRDRVWLRGGQEAQWPQARQRRERPARSGK